MQKPKRRPRRVINPLFLVAGLQKIGEKDANQILITFGLHLDEVSRGEGKSSSIRIMTIMTAALHDASIHYEHRELRELIDKAGDLWIRAGTRCTEKGINDRIVLNAEELEIMRQVYAAMRVVVPAFELGPWKSFVENATRRWDKFAAQSTAFKQFSEAA